MDGKPTPIKFSKRHSSYIPILQTLVCRDTEIPDLCLQRHTSLVVEVGFPPLPVSFQFILLTTKSLIKYYIR